MVHLPASSSFPETRWTLVLRARGNASQVSVQRALGELCREYWYPLYAYARRRGKGVEDAEDATQGFFSYLLARNLFADAEREFGRLRTFLLTAFQRYLAGEWDRERAQKRGGDREVLSLDAEAGEARYGGELIDTLTPEKLFERSWAHTVLHSALRSLAAAETEAGRGAAFGELEVFLSPESAGEADYTQAAGRLGLREDAVRQAVSRLRGKFREHLRRQIADTLRDPNAAQIEDELASLRAALRY